MELWILNQLRNKNQKWCVLGFSNFLAFFLPCQRRYVGKYTTAKCPWWTNLWRCVWIAVSWRRRWRGKKKTRKFEPLEKTLSRLFSNSELRARLLHLKPHIYCTLIPGGSLTQYSFRINLKLNLTPYYALELLKTRTAIWPNKLVFNERSHFSCQALFTCILKWNFALGFSVQSLGLLNMRSVVRRFSHSQSKIEARSWYECLKNDHAILTTMTDGSPFKDVQPDDFMPTFSIIEKKVAKKESNVQIHCDITYPIWWFCFEIKSDASLVASRT